MSERETRDFMSVDSFSQLPFIRPASTKEKPAASGTAGIRLFGFDVPQEPDANSSKEDASKDSTSENNNNNNNNNNKSNSDGCGSGESGRKFECHYCCRNFPTSQALGGHQNAHKRERQHAKRVHFQSVGHHHYLGASEGYGYGYGLLGYHRLGSLPSAARFGIGHAFEPAPPPHYPSWNTTTNNGGTGPCFYNGFNSVSQPINGSPVPGLWRVPAAATPGGAAVGLIHGDRMMAAPLLGGHDMREGGVVGSPSSSSSTSLRQPYGSMPGVKDSVSLDLHL